MAILFKGVLCFVGVIKIIKEWQLLRHSCGFCNDNQKLGLWCCKMDSKCCAHDCHLLHYKLIINSNVKTTHEGI